MADKRIVRLIQKWLAAGVLQDGKRIQSEVGTVQGGSISPLLANIYLHYVFDLWVQRWRQKQARGDVVVVRWADDCVVGFQHRIEAERFLAELRSRMHDPIPLVGAYLRSVVLGHVRYYGVPMNGPALGAFRLAVGRLWWHVLRSRSQGNHLPWRRMRPVLDRSLPPAHICHLYPLVRLGVITQGGSRMR